MSAADPATLAAIQRVTKRCLAEIDSRVCLLDLRYGSPTVARSELCATRASSCGM